MTANEAVAAEIRAQLARRRLSQTDLARQLGVSRPWVSRRMTGLTSFGIDDIARIADALDTTTVELVRDVDELPRARARATRMRRSDSERTA